MSNPQDMFKKLQRMANDAGRRGGGGPAPKGLANAVGGSIALVALLMVGNNALFNVDGGHRAIKYTRIGGVGKQIYGEGRKTTFLRASFHRWQLMRHFFRNTHQDPMVRDTHRLRRTSEATQCRLSHWHERFTNGQHYLSCPLSTPR
jgi:hypothetical protein